MKDTAGGMPPSFDARTDGGFGLTLVRVMAGQIGGELLLDSSPGAGIRCSVRFPRDRRAGCAAYCRATAPGSSTRSITTSVSNAARLMTDAITPPKGLAIRRLFMRPM